MIQMSPRERRVALFFVGSTLVTCLTLVSLATLLRSKSESDRTRTESLRREIESAMTEAPADPDRWNREIAVFRTEWKAFEAETVVAGGDIVRLRTRLGEIQSELTESARKAGGTLPADLGFPSGGIPEERIPVLDRRAEAIRAILSAAFRSGVRQITAVEHGETVDAEIHGAVEERVDGFDRDPIRIRCRGTPSALVKTLEAVAQDRRSLSVIDVQVTKKRPQDASAEGILTFAVLTARPAAPETTPAEAPGPEPAAEPWVPGR